MGRFDVEDGAKIILGSLLIIFGFIVTVVIAEGSPFMAAVMLSFLGFVGFLAWGWWTIISSEKSRSEPEGGATDERDSFEVLKERYARGEISEEEFEHRLTVLLDVDSIAAGQQEAEKITERE